MVSMMWAKIVDMSMLFVLPREFFRFYIILLLSIYRQLTGTPCRPEDCSSSRSPAQKDCSISYLESRWLKTYQSSVLGLYGT